MTPRPFSALLLSSLLLSAGAHARPAANVIPIEHFSRDPAITSVSMSADGKRLVALIANSTAKGTPSLATWDLDNLAAGPISITPGGDRMKFIAAFAMKADKSIVVARQEWTGRLAGCGEGSAIGATKTFLTKYYLTDSRQTTFDEAFESSVRQSGVTADARTCQDIAGTARLIHSLPMEPEHVLIERVNTQSLASDVYRYNLTTGATELLVKGGGDSSHGLFHPRSGELLTRTEIVPAGAADFEVKVLVKSAESGEFEVHDALTTSQAKRHGLAVVGIDDKTGKLYIITDKFSDLAQVWAYDPNARSFDKEPLLEHPEFPIAELLFDSREATFNQVIGFVVAAERSESHYLEPGMKSLHEGLKAAFPGLHVDIVRASDDRSRVLFTTDSARHPVAYHVLTDRKAVTTLGSERPWIDGDRIGEQRWVVYPARDGRSVPALLDLPAGWTQGDPALPAIILPHGGPYARDYAGWDFSGWIPFLTSRGYAVLRPQYRGSTGFGVTHEVAGDRQWGLKMQDDKDDGVSWLVSQGIAAKDRVAIFGYSYGGFAAAAAVVRSPSPYQCAVSGAPVTDLGRLGNTWGESRTMRVMHRYIVGGMDPMRHVSDAVLPVLLFVGDRDVRTPAFHARSFYDAVKGKVPAKFELIADMPHSMPWYPQHIEQSLALIESFLAEECGPGGL